MRLVMMGTGPFAVPTFASLLDSSHVVCALVTRPAVIGQTRGKTQTPPNPMRELAESRGVPVLAPDSVNDESSRRALEALGVDLYVVCDYGQILSAETLAVAPLGGINLHGSLLPKYRGAAPIQWALWHGEQETGVTVIHMDPRLDAGPCLVQCSTLIGPTETAVDLEPRLAQLGVGPVHQALELLSGWDGTSPLGKLQDPAQATRAPRLKKRDGEVDWTRAAADIFCQFRAVQPWPGLFTYYFRPSGEPLRVILEQVAAVPTQLSHLPGFLAPSDGQGFLVATGRDALRVSRLQPAGKRAMDAAEFLRGYPLHAGARFGPCSTVQAQ